MMKKCLLASLLIISVVTHAQKENPAVKFAAVITPQSMKDKLSILAGSQMEGRETGMPGERRAAAFIEEHFRNIGLKPGNGNSYQQTFPVYLDEINAKQLRVNGRNFEWDKDYTFSMQSEGNILINEIVFAGYGIVDKAANRNDFEGLDLKGKLVMILDGGPADYKAPAVPAGTRAPNPLTYFSSGRYLWAEEKCSGACFVRKTTLYL